MYSIWNIEYSILLLQWKVSPLALTDNNSALGFEGGQFAC